MVANNIPLPVIDVSSHVNLINQEIAFTEDFSYAATIPYNSVAPTVTDIMPQLSSVDDKRICPLVRETVYFASPVSLSNECGCTTFGVCNPEGHCECVDGYSGFVCSYSNADYLSLTTQVLWKSIALLLLLEV